MRSKSIWSVIWIIGALLVIATLDNVPDPPAANPSGQTYAASLYKFSVAVVTPNSFAGALFRLPLIPAIADAVVPSPRYRPIILSDRAADLPPPVPPSQLESSFQA